MCDRAADAMLDEDERVCCDLEYLKSGLGKVQLRRSVDALDACLKHARRHSPNDAEELVSLSHRLVVALALLLPDEQRSILRLTSADEDDTKRVLLFHHILVQSARYVQNSPVADEEVKLECAGAEAEANYLLDELAESFPYTEVLPVFMAMQATNIAVPIIERGKEIFDSDRETLEPIQTCVYDMLHHINDSIVNGVDAETFKQEHIPLRHTLGVAIKKLTGKTPNLGDGLALFTLIVVMNFATPECKNYVCRYSDWLNKMSLLNACVAAWLKSFATLVDKDAGLVNSTHRGPDGAVAGIGLIDRLFFVSKSNKSKNGEVQDMDEVLEDGRIDKVDVHLSCACNLLAKVVYIKLDPKGKRPSILATGAPVRDNLFQQPEAMISPYAEFPGCLPHSEMWMKKHFMLARYVADEFQAMSQTMNLAYSVVDGPTASINSKAAEKWVRLHEMTPEEHAAFRELVAEAMAANSKKGGDETALLLLLAKAMEKKGWNEAKLSPEMKEDFSRFLRKDDYNGVGGRDRLIENMKSRRRGWAACQAQSSLLAAFRETAEKEEIVDVISVEVLGLLPPEPRAVFDRLSRETYDGNDALLLDKLESKRIGLAACQAQTLLLSAFRETANARKIADVISVEVLRLLPPEPRAAFDRLAKEQYDGDDALLLDKLESKRGGLGACHSLSSLFSAFWKTATERKIVDVISEETLRLLPDEHKASFQQLSREQYDSNDALLLQKLKNKHDGLARGRSIRSLRAAFQKTAIDKEIAHVYSDKTLSLLPSKPRAEFDQLSQTKYDGKDALLLQKLSNNDQSADQRAAEKRKKKRAERAISDTQERQLAEGLMRVQQVYRQTMMEQLLREKEQERLPPGIVELARSFTQTQASMDQQGSQRQGKKRPLNDITNTRREEIRTRPLFAKAEAASGVEASPGFVYSKPNGEISLSLSQSEHRLNSPPPSTFRAVNVKPAESFFSGMPGTTPVKIGPVADLDHIGPLDCNSFC